MFAFALSLSFMSVCSFFQAPLSRFRFFIEYFLFSFLVFFALLRVGIDGRHDRVVRVFVPFLFRDFLLS
jgi:hypothetical protein